MADTEVSIPRRIIAMLVRVVTWPVRRWRVVALLVVALMIAYTIADQVLLRQLAAQREAIRSAGGAVELADLRLPKLEPSENAAVPYRHASALLGRVHRSPEDEKLLERLLGTAPCACDGDTSESPSSAPLTDAEWKAIGEYVAASQPALEMVKEGCALKGCQFGNYESSEALVAAPGSISSDLTLVRALAREVATRALWESHNSNIDGGLEWVTLGLHLSNGFESEPYSLTGIIRAMCADKALFALEAVLCERDVSVRPDQLAKELTQAADRRMIALTFQGERCFSAARYTDMSVRTTGLWRPFMTFNQMTGNEVLGWFVDASLQSDFAQRDAAYTKINVETTSMSNLYVVAKIMAPSLLRSVQQYEQSIAYANLAQIAIALKRYKKEVGSYPEGLSSLAPKFIAELPMDNFSGKPYLYKPVGQGFVVYSLGKDGRDDGGKRGEQRMQGDIVWCAKK